MSFKYSNNNITYFSRKDDSFNIAAVKIFVFMCTHKCMLYNILFRNESGEQVVRTANVSFA